MVCWLAVLETLIKLSGSVIGCPSDLHPWWEWKWKKVGTFLQSLLHPRYAWVCAQRSQAALDIDCQRSGSFFFCLETTFGTQTVYAACKFRLNRFFLTNCERTNNIHRSPPPVLLIAAAAGMAVAFYKSNDNIAVSYTLNKPSKYRL